MILYSYYLLAGPIFRLNLNNNKYLYECSESVKVFNADISIQQNAFFNTDKSKKANKYINQFIGLNENDAYRKGFHFFSWT